MTPVFVSGQWVWLTDEGMKPLSSYEVEELKKGELVDE